MLGQGQQANCLQPVKQNYEFKIYLAMERKDVRSTAYSRILRRNRAANLMRRCMILVFFACTLMCSKLMAQVITIDGNPGDWPAVLGSSAVPFKAYVRDP